MMLSHRLNGPTANDCWLSLIDHIANVGVPCEARGLKFVELIGIQTIFPMRKPIVTCAERKLGYKFMFAEAHWILTGDDRVETIAPFSKRIAEFSDDGETFYGAYGPQIWNQSYYVCEKLRHDQHSRQAVMTIWQENPPFDTKDTPCTISVQFLIRDNKLYCIDNMRSSDAWLGWPYDVFNFTMLSGLMLLTLKPWYPSLELGDLIMNIGSSHLYFSDLERVQKCLDNPSVKKFNYPHFIPSEEFKDSQALIDHLYFVSRGEYDKLESRWVHCVARGDHDKTNVKEITDASQNNG